MTPSPAKNEVSAQRAHSITRRRPCSTRIGACTEQPQDSSDINSSRDMSTMWRTQPPDSLAVPTATWLVLPVACATSKSAAVSRQDKLVLQPSWPRWPVNSHLQVCPPQVVVKVHGARVLRVGCCIRIEPAPQDSTGRNQSELQSGSKVPELQLVAGAAV
jgi:hypothetical protein